MRLSLGSRTIAAIVAVLLGLILFAGDLDAQNMRPDVEKLLDDVSSREAGCPRDENAQSHIPKAARCPNAKGILKAAGTRPGLSP